MDQRTNEQIFLGVQLFKKALNQARQTAAEIVDPYDQTRAWIAIAGISKEVKDIEQAYQASDKIDNSYTKVMVWVEIAKASIEI